MPRISLAFEQRGEIERKMGLRAQIDHAGLVVIDEIRPAIQVSLDLAGS